MQGVILAFDLSWSGLTGWCLWNGALSDPILDYGEFEPKVKSTLKGAARVQAIGVDIGRRVMDLLTRYDPALCVYEQTDWFQTLSGRVDWKKLYKRERLNQVCLGRAEMALLMAAAKVGVPAVAIGATEAKKEYNVQYKDSAANILASSFPHRLEFDSVQGDPRNWWVLDLQRNVKLSSHITDAMVIADVVWHQQRGTMI